jgi:superoxide dismutase, Cu-Zn family
MSLLKMVGAAAVPLMLAACVRSGPPLAGTPASNAPDSASAGAPAGSAVAAASANGYAIVTDSSGQKIGTATLTQDGTGAVRIQMRAQGLTPGLHGVHFHAVGSCVPPAFVSAGGHFNPEAKHHGLSNPAGPHAGDLPNMTVDSAGNSDYSATTSRVSLTPGANSLFDADGSALVIHAAPDDNMTDPAGNAGARLGCGAVQSGMAPG